MAWSREIFSGGTEVRQIDKSSPSDTIIIESKLTALPIENTEANQLIYPGDFTFADMDEVDFTELNVTAAITWDDSIFNSVWFRDTGDTTT